MRHDLKKGGTGIIQFICIGMHREHEMHSFVYFPILCTKSSQRSILFKNNGTQNKTIASIVLILLVFEALYGLK